LLLVGWQEENNIKMSKPKNKKGQSANAKQNAGNATAKKAKNGGKKK
jgi:hypothetical protein